VYLGPPIADECIDPAILPYEPINDCDCDGSSCIVGNCIVKRYGSEYVPDNVASQLHAQIHNVKELLKCKNPNRPGYISELASAFFGLKISINSVLSAYENGCYNDGVIVADDARILIGNSELANIG
jgi:hypothetical protein